VQQQTVILRNTDGTNPVYIGGPGVTSGSGFPLAAGQQITLGREPLYARATGGSVNVAVISLGAPA